MRGRIAATVLALTALMGAGTVAANAPVEAPATEVATSHEGAHTAPYMGIATDYPISHEFSGLDEALEYCSWVEGEELQFDCMVAAFMVYDRHEIQA